MKQNYVVTQSNKLIEARHDVPLTTREQKIILTMVSMIQPEDEDFSKYRISIKEFSEMLGLKGSAKYDEIKDVAQRLQKKSVYIQEESGFVVTNWVSSQRYKEGEGVIELAFSPELKPYLLQLKNQFTTYKLSNILSLKSVYSIRLYELIKKWQHLGKWDCPVEELKIKLGATTSTFDRYNLFKVRVLELAIKELNEKTDVNVIYEETRRGRKVEKITFRIRHAHEKELQLPEHPELPEEPKGLPGNDISTRLNDSASGYSFDKTYFEQMYQVAAVIWNDNAEKELDMLIRYVNEEESINNPLGFIKSKLQTAWDVHNNGMSITFADLKPSKRKTGREEMVPEWFNKPYKAPVHTEEEKKALDEKRNALQESLGEMKGKELSIDEQREQLLAELNMK